jgi:O-antigen/teichoic acid export membrane protein
VSSLLLLLSGFAALVYQVLWMRDLAVLFGNSAHAAAVDLAVFFGGIAAGAALFARVSPRVSNPLRAYGLMELGIAAAALLVFLLLRVYAALYAPLYDRFSSNLPVLVAIKAVLACEAGTKVAVAVALLVWLWPTVEAGLLAVVAGAAVAAAASVLLLRFLPRARAPVEPIPHPYAYSLTTLLSLVLLALLLSVDVLAAKRYLPGSDAGLYAAVSLCGKIVFFATSAFSVVLFPFFSARQEEGRDSRRHLAVALAAIAGVSGALVAVYFLVPSVVVRPLYGDRFEAAGDYLGWIGVAYACYAFVYLTAMYLLSQQQARGTGMLAVAVLAQLAALYTFHSSIWAIIGVQLGTFAATAAVLAVLARGATVTGVAAAATASEAG